MFSFDNFWKKYIIFLYKWLSFFFLEMVNNVFYTIFPNKINVGYITWLYYYLFKWTSLPIDDSTLWGANRRRKRISVNWNCFLYAGFAIERIFNKDSMELDKNSIKINLIRIRYKIRISRAVMPMMFRVFREKLT